MLYSIQAALIEGLLFSIAVLGLSITIRIIDFPDLTFDGSFVLGAAISSVLIINNVPQPFPIIIAVLGGCLAGIITSILYNFLNISKLLSGIITMTILYSINLIIMKGANISLLSKTNIFPFFSNPYFVISISFIVPIILVLLVSLFLYGEYGLSMRSIGINPSLSSNLGINVKLYTMIGLIIGNSMVALSGSLVSQYHRYSDISDGVGSIMMALSALIIGESIIRSKNIILFTLTPIVGSIIFYLIIIFALRLGLPPTALKLITGLIIILMLIIRNTKEREKIFKSNW